MSKGRKVAAIWREPVGRLDCGYDPWRDAGDEYWFDVRIANRVCDFIEKNIKHSKGEYAGKMFRLERWQRKVFGHLFGWKLKSDGTRRYKKMFLFLPRKNGKSFVTAALGLVFLVADDEPGAEVYCCAAEREQAALVFNEAANMVRQNAELARMIRIFDGYRAMKFAEASSFWRVLSSESKTAHGLNPSLYIVDEVHAQKNEGLIEAMETGVGARRQPVGIYISTADHAGESPCNRLVDYARKVRDGNLSDPTFFPVLYEAGGDEDWHSEAVWRAVNPNYGVCVKPGYIKSQHKKAVDVPSYENTFKRLHLNMTTEQEKRWMKMDDWDASGQRLEPSALLGQRCFAGIDLSSSKDISALALYFPDQHACLPWFWVPKATADKRIEYAMWAKQGYIEITVGKVIDYQRIRERINACAKAYEIVDIGYDPYNASQLVKQLGDDDGLPVMEFLQTYKSMNEPVKELEKAVMAHQLVHFGNPVLRWMASNTQAQEDKSGNIKLTKPTKDSPLKVDGIIALVMAFGISLAAHEEPLEHGGISFL